VFEYGNDSILFGDVARDSRDDLISNLEFGEVDNFSAEMGGLGLGDIRWSDNLVGQHEINYADTGALGFIFQRSHLVGTDKPEVNQDIYQIVVFFSHSSK
jgi:hypothetical protein